MRGLIGIGGSGLLHASLLGILWMSGEIVPHAWLPVKRGETAHSITLTASLSQDAITATDEIVVEIVPPLLDTQRVNSIREEPREALDVISHRMLSAAFEKKSVSPETMQAPSIPTENSTPQRVKKAVPLTTASLPWQATLNHGARVDELPQALPSNEPPRYPSAALLARHEGRVVLRVYVSSNGSITSLRIETSSGNSSLDEAAVAAVRHWRFTPATKMGIAVAQEVLVPVNFNITDP